MVLTAFHLLAERSGEGSTARWLGDQQKRLPWESWREAGGD